MPGANGSQWKAELTVHNASDRFVDLGPCNVPSPNPCPPQIFGLNAGATRVDPTIGFTDAGDRGRLSYVRRDVAHLLDMKLRLADVSRHAVDAGTEIPVNGTLLHSETSAFTASGYLPADGLPFAPSSIEIPLAVCAENVRIDIIPLTSQTT